MNLPVYLDYNATTPVDKRVLEEMLPYFTTYYGNAASKSHPYGWQAHEAVEIARGRVANLIGAQPEEIVFTSGATESVNLALKGVCDLYSRKGNHIITVKTEHAAVMNSCANLEKQGYAVTYLAVGKDGLIDLAKLRSAIKPETILISVMYANNETGVIQPIAEISEIATENNLVFFSDATQAVGKIPVMVKADGIHVMALSAHKMYGPKGVGALYISRREPRIRLAPQMNGGTQEHGLRAGTQNVPGIVGLGKACEICAAEMAVEGKRLLELRNYLETEILKTGLATVNGNIQHRLPNTSNISFRNFPSVSLMKSIMQDVAVSSSSACSQENLKASRIITAMYGNEENAKTAIRFSLGRFTTRSEITFAIEKIKQALVTLQV